MVSETRQKHFLQVANSTEVSEPMSFTLIFLQGAWNPQVRSGGLVLCSPLATLLDPRLPRTSLVTKGRWLVGRVCALVYKYKPSSHVSTLFGLTE